MIFEAEEYRSLKMTISSLPFDSDYFGVKCGRINLLDEVDRNDIDIIKSFDEHFKFLTIVNDRNRGSNNFFITQLNDTFLADVNVQLYKYLLDEKQQAPKEQIVFSNNVLFNEGIVDITKHAFTHSRYFNDPHLNIEKARGFYPYIIESAFNRAEKYFTYLMKNGEIAGYILFTHLPSSDAATIQLTATGNNYLRKGIFSILLKYSERALYSLGVRKIYVGTQCDNHVAIMTYIKNGFSLYESNSIYHHWPK